MSAWVRTRSCPPNIHLPPAEVSDLLYVDSKGRTKPKEMLSAPVNEFGVPDPDKGIELLLSTINQPYEWPQYTNIHHTIHPRRDYETELEKSYREIPLHKIHLQIQTHNLWHAIIAPPKKTSKDVMYACVDEHEKSKLLFQCGQRAVRCARWSENIETLANADADEAWKENTRGYYGVLARHYESNFFRLLESTPGSEVGILPLAEELEGNGVVSLTRRFGEIAAIEALDYRRRTQQTLYQRAA